MAGLSVAFDAVVRGDVAGLGPRSVPRPGSAVPGAQRDRCRAVAGGDDVTIVSTVPRWFARPSESLDKARLLIMGGEACPPEIGERLARGGREVWNTYGPDRGHGRGVRRPPGARRTGPDRSPARRVDLAVVDGGARPVPDGRDRGADHRRGRPARYLDPDMDVEVRAHPIAVGAAYRAWTRVRFDGKGWSSLAAPTTRSGSAVDVSSAGR